MSADSPARTLRLPRPGQRPYAPPGRHVAVAGAGIAGLAAATALCERGVRVTLVESETFLGGRAGSWGAKLRDGTAYEMERGFHAFFRQYYNLRSLLRRVDPGLGVLQPLEDYPILGPEGQVQSFKDLPRQTPWNVAALTWRSPAIGWRDLLGVDKRRALEMLRFDPHRTYAEHDRRSAGEYLDSLAFPPAARRLLFDVFAHSFFNPESEMSAAELLMMFHFYFTGNPEGLVFDVCTAPFGPALWEPLGRYLQAAGAEIHRTEHARRVERTTEGRWRLETDRTAYDVDGIVLALPVQPLRRVVEASPSLDDPAWRSRVLSLEPTLPFAVWRLWLDRPTRADRAPFVGTTGLGCLDNISLFHELEDESREWARRHGGAVVELHAYAVEEDAEPARLKQEMLDALRQLYPETRDARIIDEAWLLRRDCPGFSRGSDAGRPTVDTPFEGLCLAGDLVKLHFPSALMERAAASGFLAANHLLARDDVQVEPIHTIEPRGLLAGRKRSAVA